MSVPEGVPTWDEGIERLLGRLPALLADAKITINDARVIQYMADREVTRPVGCAWCQPALNRPLHPRLLSEIREAAGSPDFSGGSAHETP